jgi:ferredoxin like protein
MNAIKVEDKLYQNRYLVDEGRPHIAIINPQVCVEKCVNKDCTYVCPARCYTVDGVGGSVTLVTDGCLECGTCRVACAENRNLDWKYPRGGYGISYKFG